MAFRPLFRPYPYRTLTSSVILTRNYDSVSVAELKKLAKERGLSARGSRATILTRIREHDASRTPKDSVQQTQIRFASNSNAPSNVGSSFMNIRLPDISDTEVEPPIQTPVYPDIQRASSHQPSEPPAPVLPKVLSVSGVADHLGHGPSHNLIDAHDPHPPTAADPVVETKPTATQKPGPGVAEPLVTPAATTATSQEEKPPTPGESDFTSRNLNEEEKNGLWALLALFGTVWVFGSFVHRSPSKAKEHP